MNCYRCGSPLGAGRYCPKCSADVGLYKKIQRLSNAYYNAGLEKVRVRDMTGAITCLTRSLQLNKKNTLARNLLGLVYSEIGEVQEAITQWNISIAYDPENMQAADLKTKLVGNKADLENINSAIRKYNAAVDYAKRGSEDLAIIQLRGVIAQYSRLLKAYQLLGLLYLKDEQYAKAARVMRDALRVDRGSTFCLRCLRETRGRDDKNELFETEPQKRRKSPKSRSLSTQIRKKLDGTKWMLGLGTGIIITVLVFTMLIIPSVRKSENSRQNQQNITLYQQLDSLNRDVLDKQAQIEAKDQALAVYEGDSSILDAYQNLAGMYRLLQLEDYDRYLELYQNMNRDLVQEENYQALCDYLKAQTEGTLYKKFKNEAGNLADEREYTASLPLWMRCYMIRTDDDEVLYYLGYINGIKKNIEEAKIYYKRLLEVKPSSQFAEDAEDYLSRHP